MSGIMQSSSRVLILSNGAAPFGDGDPLPSGDLTSLDRLV